MREWEPIRDLKELFQSPQIEQPQNGPIFESLGEIFTSGKYAHIVISEDSTDSKQIEIGKIVRQKNSSIEGFHIIPGSFNIVDMLKKEDSGSMFEKSVMEIIGNYEIDRETIESALALVKHYELKTIAAFLRHNAPAGKIPKTEIAVPIALIGATNLHEAIKIGASFMKITKSCDALTSIRDELFQQNRDSFRNPIFS